jgi:hypothetical protein
MKRNKTSLGSLILAGAAAYGLYRLSKMSASDRSDLLSKGKKLVSDNLGGLTNLMGGSNGSSQGASSSTYGEHSYS